MSDLVLRGGRIIDATGERSGDVVVREGLIVAVGPDLHAEHEIDVTGCVVAPGLVDLHTHLREPGLEEAETVLSGSRAAVAGGFTAVMAMPNTTPAIDSASVVREIQELAREAVCQIEIAGAITVGRAGERLAPLGEMARLGVKFFTDDGRGLQDARVMRRAMEYAGSLGVRLAQHCEVAELAEGGQMHEGTVSSRCGLPGIPAEAEELMVMRDIALSRMTRTPIHFQHLSTAGSVAMVRAARTGGVPVSSEATPHHFTLTDEACSSFDPQFKVNPPLRPSADRQAIRQGLKDGSIDVIATDHAPHPREEKDEPFDQAPFGTVGLETALALAITELEMDLSEVLALLSWRPAILAGIAESHGGPMVEGRPANLIVFDPEEEWTVDSGHLHSRSSNTAFDGRKVRGRVRHTLFRGEPVFLDYQVVR